MRLASSPSPPEPIIVGRILLYADRLVADWMARQMGETINPPYTAFGIIAGDGQLAGAMIFNGLTEGNVEVSLCAPKTITRGVFRVAASYAFETLGCHRITARTRASKLRVRRFIERVGFQQEGTLRAYYQDGEDAILYGLLKAECRW